MAHEKQNRILTFWLGENALQPFQNKYLWFKKSGETDGLIRSQFTPLLQMASTGAFDDWSKTKSGALALVILCDQMSRNIYRHSKLAFEQDERALRAAEIAIEHKFDLAMSTVERLFLYLPFEHSEDLAHQQRSVELFGKLSRSTQLEEEKRFILETLGYAIRHREIIAKFGRFPHRNESLGRETTKAEAEFLKQPGSRF